MIVLLRALIVLFERSASSLLVFSCRQGQLGWSYGSLHSGLEGREGAPDPSLRGLRWDAGRRGRRLFAATEGVFRKCQSERLPSLRPRNGLSTQTRQRLPCSTRMLIIQVTLSRFEARRMREYYSSSRLQIYLYEKESRSDSSWNRASATRFHVEPDPRNSIPRGIAPRLLLIQVDMASATHASF